MKRSIGWVLGSLTAIGSLLYLTVGILSGGATGPRLLILVTSLVLVAPLALRVLTGRFDPFEPTVVFALAYGVMFVARPLAMLNSDQLSYVRPSRTYEIRSTFYPMLVAALIGAVAFVAGYLIASRKSTRVHERVVIPERLSMAGSILVVVACFLTALFVNSLGGPAKFFAGRTRDLYLSEQATSGYISQSTWIIIPACILLVVLAKRTKTWLSRLSATLAGVLVLVRTIPIGQRIILLPVVGGIAIALYLLKQKRPSVFTLAVAGLVGLTLSSILGLTRNALTREAFGVASTVRTYATDPTASVSSLTGGSDGEMASALATAMRVIPPGHYQYGKATIGDLVTRPIPRGIWANKPLSPREALIKRLWPWEYRKGIANPEFSVLLYPYMDLGFLGVAIWMGLYGVLSRRLYGYLMKEPKDFIRVVMYASSLPYLVIALRDSPTDTVQRMAFSILPLWILLRFAAARAGQTAIQQDHGSI